MSKFLAIKEEIEYIDNIICDNTVFENNIMIDNLFRIREDIESILEILDDLIVDEENFIKNTNYIRNGFNKRYDD
ncbi:MAG: hypothetical protein J6B89_04100 [Bacilli bacterium]|nr:hypothetical protein [Bacilli bacterium]